MSLSQYNRKRNFSQTPEPTEKAPNRQANLGTNDQILRFVIQKHDASHLHYDFRLETPSGVMKSWAVPKGLSLNPKIKRLAVLTEDHPLSYMNFEGVIPEGNYGAGSVIVWDIGTYTSQEDIESQFKRGKIRFELNGKKVKGAYFLIKMMDSEKQWLITKVNDNYSSDRDVVAELPASVLSDKTNEGLDSNNKRKSNSKVPPPSKSKGNSRLSGDVPIGALAEFPASIKPMLATAVDEPFDSDQWVFEVKWDGVRSILEWNKTTNNNMLLLKSRSGKDMTHRYPEIVSDVAQSISCNNSTILD
jgi:bifunctional non-homologous end joining protein LigD